MSERIITYDADPKQEDTMCLWEGIKSNAKKQRDLAPGKPFAFFIKNETNAIEGGCSGYIFYGCLYVDLLWVTLSLRSQGYGSRLMEQAEALAIQNGCTFMLVNTMDFEAVGFYQKLGFFVEFERHGFQKESIMYFLRKSL